MSWTPIVVVARREIEEIFGDWRMVLPLLILTFAVPLLLLLAVLSAARVFGDPSWAQSLLPLAVLLCGFLPAGFSVVNASESFVGEKERSTLESLLSTPVTDGSIYLGKLAGALLLPLCTSCLAIVTFTTSFVLLTLGDAEGSLQLWFVAPVLALSALKVAILVAGAVAISIQATSVRGANLLAAFMLVPLGAIVNLEAVLLVSERVAALAGIGIVLAVTGTLLIWSGWATFKRETIVGQERAGVYLSVFARLYSHLQRTYRSARNRNR